MDFEWTFNTKATRVPSNNTRKTMDFEWTFNTKATRVPSNNMKTYYYF